MTKQQLPIVEGLFTTGDEPHLIGGKSCRKSGSEASYFFPRNLAGRDPACIDLESTGTDGTEEVLLSRQGTVWSYTNAGYQPPLPYVVKNKPSAETETSGNDSWEPFVLAAVKLEKESLVILGQMTEGVKLEDMKIGMEVELVLDVLYEDDENEYLVWKWKPAE